MSDERKIDPTRPGEFKAQEGTWVLIAPDNKYWVGDSPLRCISKEMNERIFKGCEEPAIPLAAPSEQAEPNSKRSPFICSQCGHENWKPCGEGAVLPEFDSLCKDATAAATSMTPRTDLIRAALPEDAKEWLRRDVDFGGYDGHGKDRWHLAIAQTIEDLEVALKSQIEITNIERGQKERAEHELVAFRSTSPADGVTLTAEQVEYWYQNSICDEGPEHSHTWDYCLVQFKKWRDQALAALRIPGLEREIAEIREQLELSKTINDAAVCSNLTVGDLGKLDEYKRRAETAEAELAKYRQAEPNASPADGVTLTPEQIKEIRKENVWPLPDDSGLNAICDQALRVPGLEREIEELKHQANPAEIEGIYQRAEAAERELAEWERPCEDVETVMEEAAAIAAAQHRPQMVVPYMFARKLAADVQRMRKDADRYRWLRDEFNGDTWLMHALGGIAPDSADEESCMSPNELDAAIDAARKEKSS